MDTTPDEGWDQSWGYADPAEAAKAGRDVVSMYLSWDPSKNATAAKVKAYHQHGIGVILNWESQAGAPLAGGAKGKTDALEAVRQAKALIAEVGYPPGGRLCLYFSCDRDVDKAQYVMIDAYYRQARVVCHAAGFDVGVYGEADLVTHLAAENITDAEWQTYAWSRGVLSPDADFYQYLNGQKLAGASVDFDRVIHPAELGAWWPPAHPLNTASTATGDLLMAMTEEQINARFDRLEKKLQAIATLLSHDNARDVAALIGDADHPDAGLRDIAEKLDAVLAAVSK